MMSRAGWPVAPRAEPARGGRAGVPTGARYWQVGRGKAGWLVVWLVCVGSRRTFSECLVRSCRCPSLAQAFSLPRPKSPELRFRVCLLPLIPRCCQLSNRVAFLAVSVDASPHLARARAAATWPHLQHFWIDGPTITRLNIGFVPNRVVVDARSGIKVLRWWDGTAGNVLKGPHGKSRGNRSAQLLDELAELF